MSKEDGGSAYPEIFTDLNKETGEHDTFSCGGMSLRDWFAGQALISLTKASVLMEIDDYFQENVAQDAYMFADAMIEQRKKK